MTARVNTYRARIFVNFADPSMPAPEPITGRREYDKPYMNTNYGPRKFGWSLFIDVCERLTRDGVDFAVTLDPALGEIRIVGTWTKARKSPKPRHCVAMPKPPSDYAFRAKIAARLLELADTPEPTVREKIKGSDADVRRVADEMYYRTLYAADGDAAEYRELLTAELEHWREMELAAETRYTYRPGLTEERFAEDEEVCHAA